VTGETIEVLRAPPRISTIATRFLYLASIVPLRLSVRCGCPIVAWCRSWVFCAAQNADGSV